MCPCRSLTVNKVLISSYLIILLIAFLLPQTDANQGKFHCFSDFCFESVSFTSSPTHFNSNSGDLHTSAKRKNVPHFTRQLFSRTRRNSPLSLSDNVTNVGEIYDASEFNSNSNNSNTLKCPEDEREVPGQPWPMKSQTNSTSINVRWSQPLTNVAVRGYTIGWGKNFPDIFIANVDNSTFSYLLTDLEPLSEYVITIRAFNCLGQGVPGYLAEKTLTPDRTIKVSANVLSSSSVTLEWIDDIPSALSNAKWKTYIVRYHPHGNKENFKQIISTNTSLLIDNLEPATKYEFSVAINGDPSSKGSASNTTFQGQSAPFNLTISSDPVDPSLVFVQWKPPSPQEEILGYAIYYTTNVTLQDQKWWTSLVNEKRTNVSLHPLQPDTLYHFKVCANYGRGINGPFSSTVAFHTHANGIKIVISNETFYYASTGIAAFVLLVFICTCFICLCKTKRPDSESTTDKSIASSSRSSNKNKRDTRELNPPDLWIHHDHDFKSLEKDHSHDDSTHVLSNFHESEPNSLETCKGIV